MKTHKPAMLQKRNETRYTTNAPGLLCQTARTVSKLAEVETTSGCVACKSPPAINYKLSGNGVLWTWQRRMFPEREGVGQQPVENKRVVKLHCPLTLTDRITEGLLDWKVFISTSKHIFILRQHFSSNLTDRIFEAPFHQKTCLECFLEVLVSSNVFAVFVLVGLVVGVVHIPISEEKKLGLLKVIDGPDISILTIKFGECTLKR